MRLKGASWLVKPVILPFEEADSVLGKNPVCWVLYQLLEPELVGLLIDRRPIHTAPRHAASSNRSAVLNCAKWIANPATSASFTCGSSCWCHPSSGRPANRRISDATNESGVYHRCRIQSPGGSTTHVCRCVTRPYDVSSFTCCVHALCVLSVYSTSKSRENNLQTSN